MIYGDFGIAILTGVACYLQAITARYEAAQLKRAAKRIAAVGFLLATVKYGYAGAVGVDLAKLAITALPLIFLSIASIINGFSLLVENGD